MGVEDPDQKAGMDPDYTAKEIVKALCERKTEIVLAPFLARMAIFMRYFAPNLLFWLMYKRGRRDPHRKQE